MSHERVKTVLILILLAANLFLLSALVTDRVRQRAIRTQELETAEEILNEHGIRVSCDLGSVSREAAVYVLRRDAAEELKHVEDLLGSASAADLGGNIMFYSAQKGQASLRGTGETDILFSEPVGSARQAVQTASSVLSSFGMGFDEESAELSETADGTVLTGCCSMNGCPVYNASVTLTFGEDGLVMLSGIRLFDTAISASTDGVLDLYTLLMRFVDRVEQEGYVFSELRALTLGYLLSVEVSGEGRLTPVWHFETDTGDIYLNGLSAKTETVR